MRIKKIATRSLTKQGLEEEGDTYQIINFHVSSYFLNKNNRHKDKREDELTNHERRYCKENNIAHKTFAEMKIVYKKKGRNGLKQFSKNRKMNSAKVLGAADFFKEEEND